MVCGWDDLRQVTRTSSARDWASLWPARLDVCRHQNARSQGSVVAMRGTPVAARAADAAAGDAHTVTRHAVEEREVIVVLASSRAPLQVSSGEGVSAPPNQVPNLPKPTVARAQSSPAAVESSQHPSGERGDNFGPETWYPWRWYNMQNRQRSHMLRWKNMTKVSLQRDGGGDPRRMLAKIGITRIHSWLSRLRRSQPQTFAEMPTETCPVGFVCFKQFT